ncbi:MAG: hypothetical protein IK024_11945 [Treponema sp.]|nr:hypothetical protein [Treponema sp.]
MQKNFKTLAVIIIGVTLLLLTSCPQPQQKKGYEGTKLVVPQWPQNVEHVQLAFKNSTWALNCYNAGECEGFEYFSGEAILTIYYSRIDRSESDQYFGYGIRSNAENQFKVFVNGEEVENEFPQATYHSNRVNDDLELNANIDHFRATFNITNVQDVVVTFENAPEKILNKDIRLTDETIYAYIDTDDLEERFIISQVRDYDAEDKSYNMEQLAPNGVYFFNRYTQKFAIELSVIDNHFIKDSDTDFAVNINANISTQTTKEIICYLVITLNNMINVPTGSVVTVTGGTITPYDVSNFANKTLVFAKESYYNNYDPVSQATLELKDNGTKTFVLNIDGKEYTGTWKAVKQQEDVIIELSSKTGVEKDYKLKTIRLQYYKDGMNNIDEPCWEFNSTLLYYGTNEDRQDYNCSFFMTEKKD